MSVLGTVGGAIKRFVKTGSFKQKKSDYTIDVSGTPAGKTNTTSGERISTPNSPAQSGITSSSNKTTGGSRSGGGGSNRVTTQTEVSSQNQVTEQARQETTKVIARRGGGTDVTSNSRTHHYTGSAYIPELNMTSNEYQRKIRNELLSSGKVNKGEKNTYNVVKEIPSQVTQEYIPAEQVSPKTENLFYVDTIIPKYEKGTSYMTSSGTGFEVSELGTIKEINPQGFSYIDRKTGRGYETTASSIKKVMTPEEKKNILPSLTEVKEKYYGGVNYFRNVKEKIGEIPLGIKNRETKKEATIGDFFTRELIPSRTSTIIPKNKREEIALKLYYVLQPENILASSFPASKVPMKVVINERPLAGFSVSKEASINVIKNGEQIKVSNYNIFTEVKPPRIVLSRKGGQGLLGSSDFLEVLPSQVVKTTTPFKVIGEEPFTTFNAKNLQYGRNVNVEKVIPIESRVISPKEFSSLTQQEKVLLQKSVESRLGRPVPLKLVPKFLDENKIYVRSTFETNVLGRIKKIKEGEYDLLPPRNKLGKGTKRLLTISEVSQTSETPLTNLYKVDTFFKDVTKPLSRANGKTPRMITQGVELKEPIIVDTITDFKVSENIELYHGTTKERAEQIRREGFKEGDISLTTSKEFAQSFANRAKVNEALKGIKSEPDVLKVTMSKEDFLKYKKGTKSKYFDEVVIDKSVNYKIINEPTISQSKDAGSLNQAFVEKITQSIVNKPIPKVPRKQRVNLKQDLGLPSIGSSPSIQDSFYGKGTYERTSEESVLGITSQSLIQPTKQVNPTITIEQPKIELLSIDKNNLKLKDLEISKVKSSVREKAKNVFKEELLPKTETLIKEVQKMKDVQLEKFIQKERTITKQPTPIKPKPFTPIKPIVKLHSLPKRVLAKVQETPDVFEVFVIKGGKEISLGKKQTQFGAEELLKGKLVSGLSASGLIKKGETKLKVKELKSFGNEFRPSKTSEFKIVEKKEKRLRKNSTGREIQIFRKLKKKGSIF